MKPSTVLGFLALALPFSSAVSSHQKRHHELALRAPADVDIYERSSFDNARFTFYDVGLGACGIWNKPEDHIVALNTEQFGPGYPGQHCFKSISIWYNGVIIPATIVDECMGCPYGGLDFSRGLFDQFANEAEGVLYGSWWFNDPEEC